MFNLKNTQTVCDIPLYDVEYVESFENKLKKELFDIRFGSPLNIEPFGYSRSVSSLGMSKKCCTFNCFQENSSRLLSVTKCLNLKNVPEFAIPILSAN